MGTAHDNSTVERVFGWCRSGIGLLVLGYILTDWYPKWVNEGEAARLDYALWQQREAFQQRDIDRDHSRIERLEQKLEAHRRSRSGHHAERGRDDSSD